MTMERERERELVLDRIDGWRQDYELKDIKAAQKKIPRVIRSEELPQEPPTNRGYFHQKITRASEKGLEPLVSFRCWFEHIKPGLRTNKHGHMNEALFFVLKGRGYEIHEGKRYDWKEGDVVIVPPAVVHQHFNADPDNPATVLVVNPKPTYMFLNLLMQRYVSISPYGQKADDPRYADRVEKE
jgi:quercetin dioxygenase-like cupin family protein